MDKKEQIYYRIDGLSQLEIACRVDVNRKTVKRYITVYDAQVQSAPDDEANCI